MFLEKELSEYGIDINNLTKESWENFINKKNINYLKNLSNNVLHDGDSLIHYSLNTQINLGFIKYLVDNGFDINQKNSSGLSPLSSALKSIDIELFQIRKLMEMGAVLDEESINQALRNPDGRKKKQLIDFIKKHGYSIEGMHYFDNANLEGNDEYLMELLPTIDVNADYSNKTSIFEYVVYSHSGNEVIEYFLDNGVNLENNNDGINPLHFIRNKNISIENYQRMIDLGANVNEQNKLGQTPLHNAIFSSQPEKVKLLLKNGASVHIMDNGGKDAYDYIDKIRDKTTKENIRQLLDEYNN